MCGILGQICISQDLDEKFFGNLLDSQASRGPDFSKVVRINSKHFGGLLGHNRLSIIDLDETSNQPMEKNNVWILFNGEIYNYRFLREQYLSHIEFLSEGDTEVILNLYLTIGTSFVDLLDGFFSISILDLNKSKLYLFRDRFGVKPLFLYRDENFIQFASTLFPFNLSRNLNLTIDKSARNEYFVHGYMRSTGSIYNEVELVPPGTAIEIDLKSFRSYDSIFFNVEEKFKNKKIDYDILAFEKVLFSCFQKRMVSDVPVGVLLSGGVDSNLVALGLSSNGTNNLAAFTVSFDSGNDEIDFAVSANRLHGFDHFIRKFSKENFYSAFSNLTTILDQPFGDSSIIPSFVISSYAREKGIKVLLSADGGDELFFGYTSYFKYLKLFFVFITIYPFLKIIAKLRLDRFFKLPSRLRYIEVLNNRNYSIGELYYYFYYEAIKSDFYNIFSHGYEPKVKRFENTRFWQIPTISDLRHYLPNDILYKVDRATMAAGVEGREPFLDPELLNIAGSLKLSSMFSLSKGGKLPLKEILTKNGLGFISNKKKTGFTVDFVTYLFRESNDLVDYYFSDIVLEKTQIFDLEIVKENALDKLKKDYNLFYNVLVYQIWYVYNFHNDLYRDPLTLISCE